jgi:hypothetical protein
MQSKLCFVIKDNAEICLTYNFLWPNYMPVS